jgi:hypothetical protein
MVRKKAPPRRRLARKVQRNQPQGVGGIRPTISVDFHCAPNLIWSATDTIFSAVLPLRYDQLKFETPLPASIGWWRFVGLRAEWRFASCVCGNAFIGTFRNSVTAQHCASPDPVLYQRRFDALGRKAELRKDSSQLSFVIGNTPWTPVGELLPPSQLYPLHFLFGFNVDKAVNPARSPLLLHGRLEMFVQPTLCANPSVPPPPGRVEQCEYIYGGPREDAAWRWPSDKTVCTDDATTTDPCGSAHPHRRVVK